MLRNYYLKCIILLTIDRKKQLLIISIAQVSNTRSERYIPRVSYSYCFLPIFNPDKFSNIVKKSINNLRLLSTTPLPFRYSGCSTRAPRV
jgi:hypothetical protein